MVNRELYNIACSCVSESSYLDIQFDSICCPINKFDVLEYRASGAFANVHARENALWPTSTNDSFNTESLYIVESVEQINEQIKDSLINW